MGACNGARSKGQRLCLRRALLAELLKPAPDLGRVVSEIITDLIEAEAPQNGSRGFMFQKEFERRPDELFGRDVRAADGGGESGWDGHCVGRDSVVRVHLHPERVVRLSDDRDRCHWAATIFRTRSKCSCARRGGARVSQASAMTDFKVGMGTRSS